jgi:hypothetical protein
MAPAGNVAAAIAPDWLASKSRSTKSLSSVGADMAAL